MTSELETDLRRSRSEGRLRLLLVDDSDVSQEIWSAILEAEGYEVASARHGAEALRLVGEQPVDLVLLDVVMPGLNGFDVLERLRELYPPDRLPVIMATSQDHKSDVVRAFGLGANDYVTKPLDREVTLARIAAQLRQRRPIRESTPGPGHVRSLFEAGFEGLCGEIIDGKYRIEETLGLGNFGAVFRATQLSLDRQVAVKLLRSAFCPESVSLRRFRREGLSLSRLKHPNVVHVLDFNVNPDGLTYLVMELLEGRPLESELRSHGRLEVERALRIALPVSEVLREAHELGIIHRDIKPQNIFLHVVGRVEVVKVLDFGIAKLVVDGELEQRLTAEGNSVGTPAYMAPERFTGEPYDGASDVYSFGVMLYEMLSGEPPFVESGNSFFKLIRMHVAEPPRPLRHQVPGLPPALDELVLATLEKRPENRPSPAEIATRLLQIGH
ncbi:MAG: protein kinase [Thermoanaerobaculia bacterium]|nr:protein kinase [Thermoanaerobaculia bacterium]